MSRDFPSLTAGQIGQVTWQHLNRIFAAVEGFERVKGDIETLRDAGLFNPHTSEFFAVLGASQDNGTGTEFAFDEAKLTGDSFSTLTNGESSNEGGTAFDNPALVIPGNVARVYSFRDSTGATRYAVERAAAGVFVVKVTKDGGAAGSSVSAATWTYTVTDDDNNVLATEQTPLISFRPTVGKVLFAANGSRGLATYNGAGTFELLVVGERPSTGSC